MAVDARLSCHNLLLHPARSHDIPAVSEPTDLSERPASAVSPGPNSMSGAPQQQQQQQHYQPQQGQFLTPNPRLNTYLLDETETKRRRFSLLRFRNASDSQLSLRARRDAEKEKPPPLPRATEGLVPTTTPNQAPIAAPASTGAQVPRKKRSRLSLIRRSGGPTSSLEDMLSALQDNNNPGLSRAPTKTFTSRPSPSPSPLATSLQPGDIDNAPADGLAPRAPPSPAPPFAPPPVYSDHEQSALVLPVGRVSDSSRSDSSSAIYASTTTTHTTVKTTTTFFRLRKKPPELFPISHLAQTKPGSAGNNAGPVAGSVAGPAPAPGTQSLPGSRSSLAPPGPSASQGSIAPSRLSFAERMGGGAPSSNLSVSTTITTTTLQGSGGNQSPSRSSTTFRGRSSTMGSTSQESTDERHLQPGSSRASSATGRKSFGDLLGFGRRRQNTDLLSRTGSMTPSTPGSAKNNSFQSSREQQPFVLPERRDDETPAKYLARLEEVVSRGVVASLLARATDAFAAAALRSYMRSFSFFGDPMDMAIRKLLMEAELPKETQQIDRCLQAFANRYHECNPGIYSTPDQAYFIAFSLLILHTDVFNKNNKHKMQRSDYLKNTRGEGIADEILECFYDNISYTPFIHVEDDMDINGERIPTHKTRKRAFFTSASGGGGSSGSGGGGGGLGRSSKDLLDPYNLIIDGKLAVLRPNIKEVMEMDDHYSYLGTAPKLHLHDLQRAFFKTGVLQIISARSRPDAFMSERTTNNPDDSHVGIVDIKITKVGLLWRKDAKKKKTRSPWQEWGAILTGAKLYFFRNVAWTKSLMSQYESHVKQGHDDTPLIFKPPLEQFKPDAHMSTDGAVALVDSSYRKHKNAFVWIQHGGCDEVLLADSEDEMNDWLAKLNYAAAFRTSGVRIRGVVGARQPEAQVVQTPTGAVSTTRSRIDANLANDILTARRLIMRQKIAEADDKLSTLQKQLESQLRNARHLQILAPIQGKSRESMLLAAARMSTKLKWTRVDIWRLTCHRDILLLDLEEEERLNGPIKAQEPKPPKAIKDVAEHDNLPGAVAVAAIGSSSSNNNNNSSSNNNSNNGNNNNSPPGTPPEPAAPSSPIPETPKSPRSPATAILRQPQDLDTVSANDTIKPSSSGGTHSPTTRSNPDTAHDDVPAYQSPPPSPGVTVPKQSTHEDVASHRSPTQGHRDDDDEEDQHEQELLRAAGVIGATPISTPERTAAMPADSHDGAEVAGSGDRADKSKIRRSLQRTLREGAGHLSHHRSRRGGRENTQSMVLDDSVRDDVLTRGTGSFVVHGKKASVITFGSELQQMSNEEKLRQRRQTVCEDGSSSSMVPLASAPSSLSIAASTSASAPSVVDEDTATAGHAHTHTHAQTPAGSEFTPSRSHRDSTASTDTATARSFRDLHRKYSSAQAARVVSASGRLALPSDDDSEAAVSFSDGRRSPMPPDADIAEERESQDGAVKEDAEEAMGQEEEQLLHKAPE